MEVKRQEIWQLNQKIDQLYAIVKQLGSRIGWDGVEDLCFSVQTVTEDFELVNDFTARQQDLELHGEEMGEDNNIEDNFAQKEEKVNSDNHKDILIDEQKTAPRRFAINTNNDDISCEEQVQRLTAQLTAAYHRIASLEDQLLAHRGLGEARNNSFYGNH